MGFDIIKKDENYHEPRPDGHDVPPPIRHATGNGSQYTQAWKVGKGPNWLDQKETVGRAPARTGVLRGFFHRDKDAKD
jgi:hypothetical protein